MAKKKNTKSIWYPGTPQFPSTLPRTTVPGGGDLPRGEGLRVRFSRIPGRTTTRALAAPIYLPVVLDQLDIEEEFAWTDYSTVSDGDFAIPSGGADPAEAFTLREFDLDTLTIDWEAPWLVEKGVDGDFLRAELYRLARSKTPFAVYSTLKFGGPPEIGGPSEVAEMNARITRLARSLRHGESDTRYLTISLADWRDPAVERAGDLEGRNEGRNKLPLVHKLDVGESLYDLSRRYYGDYEGWRTIAKANGLSGKVGGKDNLLDFPYLGLRVGSSIKIPKRTTSK